MGKIWRDFVDRGLLLYQIRCRLPPTNVCVHIRTYTLAHTCTLMNARTHYGSYSNAEAGNVSRRGWHVRRPTSLSEKLALLPLKIPLKIPLHFPRLIQRDSLFRLLLEDSCRTKGQKMWLCQIKSSFYLAPGADDVRPI